MNSKRYQAPRVSGLIHPFLPGGAHQSDWLQRLGFNQYVVFSYPAPNSLREYVTREGSHNSHVAAHGVVKLEEPELLTQESLPCWYVQALVVEQPALKADITSRIRLVVTQMTNDKGVLYVYEQLIADEPKVERPLIIRDIGQPTISA